LAGELATADAWDCQPEDWLDPAVVDRAEEVAFSHMETWRGEREAEGQRYADAVVEAQLESLRLGYERRIQRIDAREVNETHPTMLRMLRGQRRNTDRRYDRKRAEIENKRKVGVGLDLVAAGVVQVREEAA